MPLTVGDIRKALEKYDDDTIVACQMTTDDYGGWTIPYPVKKSNAIKTKVLSHDKLFERQWLKADLSGKKVVQLDFDFNESDEFYAHNDEQEHPYWKPMIDKRNKELEEMARESYSFYHSGSVFY